MINHKLIKLLRTKRGLTMDALATAAECDRYTVQLIEAGKRRGINTRTLEGIAGALGVPPGDLLTVRK